MNLVKRFAVLLAITTLFSVAASAQTTSTLTGTVSLGGNPLPGSTVTISSPALQGVRTTNSDVNGNYNFGALPPGTYTVKFDMESMQSVSKTVQLTLSGTARADADMKLTTVAEAITVTAAAPAVLETTEIQANIPQSLVQQLPMARTLVGATSLAPGVNQAGPNGAVTINGAPSYETLFMVNGAVVNENLRGQPHNLFIEDAIQETTVLTGAVSAEYGRFTGGVVNAITKSGGNEFTGSFRDSLTNPKWTSVNKKFYDARPDILAQNGGVIPTRLSKLNSVYEATIGGRIIRDRLWFFLAGRDAKLSDQRSLLRSTTQFTFADKNTRYEGKLTGQVTPKHTLIASYLDIKNPQTNNCFQSKCLELSNIDAQRELPNNFKTLHYNGILTNSLLIEANYSKKFFAFKGSGGDFSDFAHGTWGNDLESGGYFGAPIFCGFCDSEQRNNKLYGAKATYYLASKSLGTHNIVTGYDQWAEQRIANNYQSGSNFEVYVYNSPKCANGVCYPYITAGDFIQYTPIPTLTKGSNFKTDSLYVNDKWDLNNRFSFNLGVRYDKNNGSDSTGTKVASDKAYSPRLGMIFDVQGNGRFRVDAAYSRYVSRIAETIGGAGSGAGNPSYIYYEYRGPDIGKLGGTQFTTPQAFQLLYDYFLKQGGLGAKDLIIGGGVSGLTTKINGSLRSPHVDEQTLGFGSQLTSNAFFRVDYVRRNWKDFYSRRTDLSLGQVSDPFDNKFDRSVIENSNDYKRKYDGINLQAAYRPLQRVNIGTSYTYSKLKGNVLAETGGSGPVTENDRINPEYKAFAQNNPVGFLSADQRHRLRAWVSYDLPTPVGTFNLSALQRFDSGNPYSSVGTIDVRSSNSFYGSVAANCPNGSCKGGLPNPGYANAPKSVNYYFGSRGRFRTDSITATDLAVNYELALSRVTFFVHPEILNVFNRQSVLAVDTTVRTAKNSSSFARFNPLAGDVPKECPAGTALAQCKAMGANFQLGPNFGLPRTATTGSPFGGNGDFQTPRTYRVGVGLRF